MKEGFGYKDVYDELKRAPWFDREISKEWLDESFVYLFYFESPFDVPEFADDGYCVLVDTRDTDLQRKDKRLKYAICYDEFNESLFTRLGDWTLKERWIDHETLAWYSEHEKILYPLNRIFD